MSLDQSERRPDRFDSVRTRVNIANFALGREREGKKPVKALALVQVDAPVSDKVLEALGTIEALLEVKLVQLPEADQ